MIICFSPLRKICWVALLGIVGYIRQFLCWRDYNPVVRKDWNTCNNNKGSMSYTVLSTVLCTHTLGHKHLLIKERFAFYFASFYVYLLWTCYMTGSVHKGNKKNILYCWSLYPPKWLAHCFIYSRQSIKIICQRMIPKFNIFISIRILNSRSNILPLLSPQIKVFGL